MRRRPAPEGSGRKTTREDITMSNSMRLVEALSAEIGAYRHRVLTTFRDVAIVQALLTWGPAYLQNVPKEGGPTPVPVLIRAIAVLGCLAVGGLGIWLVYAYRNRILYVRMKRNLVARLGVKFPNEQDGETVHPVFYPINEDGPKGFEAPASARVYSAFLVASSLLTASANVVLAFLKK